MKSKKNEKICHIFVWLDNNTFIINVQNNLDKKIQIPEVSSDVISSADLWCWFILNKLAIVTVDSGHNSWRLSNLCDFELAANQICEKYALFKYAIYLAVIGQ